MLPRAEAVLGARVPLSSRALVPLRNRKRPSSKPLLIVEFWTPGHGTSMWYFQPESKRCPQHAALLDGHLIVLQGIRNPTICELGPRLRACTEYFACCSPSSGAAASSGWVREVRRSSNSCVAINGPMNSSLEAANARVRSKAWRQTKGSGAHWLWWRFCFSHGSEATWPWMTILVCLM